MKPLTRTTIGAAIGSLIVLLLHPISRPYVLGGLVAYGPSTRIQSSPALAESFDVLPQPKTMAEASIWVHEGAERLNRREAISPRILRSLIRICEAANHTEPGNAFWPQMAAVFAGVSGQSERATEYWQAASLCRAWNDYQSARFDAGRRAMAPSSGIPPAWSNAAFYYRRSKDCAKAIHRFGRGTLGGVGILERSDLDKRIVTLRNGALLRDNSRSIGVGVYGVDMVEAASTTTRNYGSSPRKLIAARYTFIDSLRDQKLIAEVEEANAAFLDNDAWLALLLKEKPTEAMHEWSLASILTASAPGSLLICALVGYGVAAFGSLLASKPSLTFLVRSPVAPIVGIGLSVAVYLATGLVLFALSIAGCFAFLAMVPVKERSHPPSSFGPLFDFAIGGIALGFSVCVVVFLVGATTPAFEVAPFLDISPEYFGGQTLPLALAVIIASLVLLIAPLWALTLRIATTHVVSIAIRNFGFDVAVLCGFLGIISIPVAIFVDQKIEPHMSRALLNEPTFYLTR